MLRISSLIVFVLILCGFKTNTLLENTPPRSSEQSVLKVSETSVANRTMDELVGAGRFVLDGDLNDFVRVEYLRSKNAGFVIASADGKYADVTYCERGVGECEIDDQVLKLIDECEHFAKQSCFLLMRGHDVVWRGDIRIRESKSGLTRPDELNDTQICHFGILHNASTATWATGEIAKYYAEEAKKRELSLQDCNRFVENSDAMKSKFHIMSDVEICNMAITGVGGVDTWSPTRKNLTYVNEGIARGFTPVTCMDSIFNTSK